MDPKKNLAYRLFSRAFRISENVGEGRFLVVENGHRVPTRLLLVLVGIEATDLLFAVDSIPAVLAVTTDAFIVYTSNIFAVLGLRALYFLLAGWMARFRYLNVGLALVLAFIGLKMIGSQFAIKLPAAVSLAVVGGLLTLAIGASVWADSRERRAKASKLEAGLSAPPAQGKEVEGRRERPHE